MKTIFALLVLSAFAIPSLGVCDDEIKTDQKTTQHDTDNPETEQPEHKEAVK